MTKFNDLNEEQRETEEDLLESKANALGLDKWESNAGNYNLLEDAVGVCAKCKNMKYCKTEFNDVLAYCKSFEIRLSGQNRVVECNEYSPRGSMSLRDMEQMAILINSSEPEIKGFISRHPKLLRKE